MERQIPKNVRQIGNVSGSPKIYMEDYVDTFLGQLCEKAGENPTGAFLIGDIQHTEEEDYIYIYGAVRMNELKTEEGRYILDDDIWKSAYEDCKQYFEDGEMLGWFAASAGGPLFPDENMVNLHKKSFPKENTVFIMRDAVEKEEAFFVHRFSDLIEVAGHYTYYEKNPCMQNYMISCRKKNGVCPSETVEDRAAKDFRSLVRAREERQRQKRTSRMMYAMSACLVLVVLVMGVVTMNNFDKMRSVQDALQVLSESAGETDRQDKTTVSEVPDGGGDDVRKESDQNDDARQDSLTQEDKDAQKPADANDSTNQDPGQTDTGTQNAAGASAGEASSDALVSGLRQSEAVEASGTVSAADTGNGSDGVYVVEDGDTLAIISQKIYGDISHVDAICRMNGLTDGNLIYIGQKLLLP